MVKGVILVGYTEQGRRTIKDSPDRAEASKGEAAKMGIQLKDLFYTPGGPRDAASKQKMKTMKRNKCRVTRTVFLLGLAFLVSSFAGAAQESSAGSARVNPVLEWNQIFIDTLIATNTPNSSSQRLGAIVHTAIFDAYNGIERRYTPVFVQDEAPRGASRRAAVIAAAYTALVGLFPSRQPALDAAYVASLAALGGDGGQSREHGIAWGVEVAERVLAWRATDGFSASYPPFTGGTGVGQWRPTPPAFSPMSAQGLAFTSLFVLDSHTQFQPEPPRSLVSDTYTDDFNTVKALGRRTGSARTEDQTALAPFWEGNASVHWNQAANQMAQANRLSLSESNRLLTVLNIAMADTAITIWSSKRFYGELPNEVTWRPVTSIPLADFDGNLDTDPDPDWLPLINTPSHPEYPAGHPSLNGAAATVLLSYFDDDQTFTLTTTGLPSRTYTSIAQARADGNNARVWGGMHYPSTVAISDAVGEEIAEYVNRNDRRFDVVETTIPQIQAALDAGRLTCRQLVRHYLRRIRAYDQGGPHLNAIRDLNPRALQIARELDRERRHSGRRGPLHCIPVLLKDNIDTVDQPTTAGSLALEGSFPLDDAFITQRLRDAGAIILGKANLTEFSHHLAAGEMPRGFSSLGGFTFNPYDPRPLPDGDGRPVLEPGSSSSGSAVAVNANLVSVAIGTETISSIIGPASINAIVGIKPTRGLLSRAGIIPVSDSQDTPGPMGRTVTDAAILLGALTGVDPEDPAMWESEGQFYRDYTPFLDADALRGARIGVPRDFFWDGLTAEKRTIMESAIALMENLGAQIIDADIPNARNLMPRNFVLDYELKRDLNAYLGRLGPQAPVRTLADVIAFNEAHAEQALRYGQDLFLRAEAVDLEIDLERYLAARARDVRLARDEGLDFVLQAYQLDALLFPERLGSYLGAKAGYPSVSVPAGYTSDGAGYGVTFMGRAFSEPVLIGLAYAYEQASLARRPPASTPPLR